MSEPRTIVACLACVAQSLLAGCVTPGGTVQQDPAQQVSTSCPFFSPKMLQGAVVGGVAGGAVVAAGSKNSGSDILSGIVGGAVAGGLIGKLLDSRDCEAARVALQRMANAPAATPVQWSNPGTGNRGSYVATSPPTPAPGGQLCRNYRQTLVLKDGTTRQQEGRTCRDANGDWQPVA